YVARSQGAETEWDKPMLRDRVLRQAVDLLTVNDFLAFEAEEEAESDKKEAKPEAQSAESGSEGEKSQPKSAPETEEKEGE
ncbi:MAG: hypothetical protein KDN20_23060, partial [Verrucomicrobiae bacterium]|nr:hypothetical protein [Verrucomicrobiae bacterium]